MEPLPPARHSSSHRLLLLQDIAALLSVYVLVGILVLQNSVTTNNNNNSTLVLYRDRVGAVVRSNHPTFANRSDWANDTANSHSSNNDGTSMQQLLPTCPESQCTPFQRLVVQQYRDLRYLFTGRGSLLETTSMTLNNQSGSLDSNFAVCEFQTMDAYSFHFPHTMQQLYRCWSWWRLQRQNNSNSQAVLVFPRSEMPRDNAFLTGFAQTLQAAIALQIVKQQQQSNANNNHQTAVISFSSSSLLQQQEAVVAVVQPRVPNNLVDPNDIFQMQDPTRPYYAMHQVDDAKVLRDTIVRQLVLVTQNMEGSTATAEIAIETTTTTSACRQQQHQTQRPRIAVLNRHGHREWTNAQAFVERLVLADRDRDLVPIVYFDSNTTFADQVNFFGTTDVLISPHGAQLTGIAFMPECGAVLEIFPVGYYLPHFFGSLAHASNLRHGSVSLTASGDWETESAKGMQDQAARQTVRNKALCPELDTILHAVEQLIGEWQQCCQSVNRKQSA